MNILTFADSEKVANKNCIKDSFIKILSAALNFLLWNKQ